MSVRLNLLSFNGLCLINRSESDDNTNIRPLSPRKLANAPNLKNFTGTTKDDAGKGDDGDEATFARHVGVILDVERSLNSTKVISKGDLQLGCRPRCGPREHGVSAQLFARVRTERAARHSFSGSCVLLLCAHSKPNWRSVPSCSVSQSGSLCNIARRAHLRPTKSPMLEGPFAGALSLYFSFSFSKRLQLVTLADT